MIDLVAEQSALGGLERWLCDDTITEVIVNGGTDVWIERNGTLQRVGTMRPRSVLTALEHILSPIGRRLDRSSPTVDARLADGSRVCAAIPPVAIDGPMLAIRRFAVRPVPLAAFTSPGVQALLVQIVCARCNVLVSGATSSGKTTLLNALAAHVDASERIITMEDVAELRLAHPHVVRMETRAATPDGVGEILLAELLRTALRLRPDRLVVGEIRGAEATDLLQALNTGHDGSLATIHANSAMDALARLSSLVLQQSPGWPLGAIHDHVRRSVDVIVHVHRGRDGVRQIGEVAEVIGSADTSGLAVRPLVSAGDVVAELRRRRR
jgi:pilus assembly protein CpaF